MASLREIAIQLTTQGADQSAQNIGKVEKSIDSMGKSAQRSGSQVTSATGQMEASWSKMEKSLAPLQQYIAAAFGAASIAAIAAFVNETVIAGLAMERLNAQFKAVAGVDSAREMSFIREEAKRLGLNLQETAGAYAKFLASTKNTSIEGEATRKIFVGVSEAVTALKLTSEESSGIFLALSQMMSKGKISAEELTGQLNERLPGATKMAADALGLTTAELLKQMQEGKLMSADVLPKLAEQLHKTYGASAVEAAGQGQGAFNRFTNALFETKAAIGQALLPAFKSIADGLVPAIEKVRQFIALWQILAVKTAAYMDRRQAGMYGRDRDPDYQQRLRIIQQAEEESIADIKKNLAGSSSQKTATELAAEQARNAARKQTEAASTSKTASDKAARAAEQWRKTYADLQLEIEKLNPSLDEHARKIADINNRYTDLMNKKGADITKLQALKTEMLAAIETRRLMDEAIAQNKTEMDEYKASQDATSAAETAHWKSVADTIKQIESLQPGSAFDTLFSQISQFQAIAEQFPDMADKVLAAIDKLKSDFNNSSGLSTLLQSNSDLEIDLMESQFDQQQAMLDRSYNATKSKLENELKLAALNADKRSALEKALALEKEKYDKGTAKNSNEAFKSQLSMVSNYAGVASGLFSKMAESQDQSSREGFEAAKKYNTAAAGMSMAAGIIGAFAGNGTMYEKIANAAIVAATGAAQIAAIEKTAFGGSGSSVSFSGSAAGAGANGGGVAGSSIGSRYVSVQDSQTAESLQALADSADNASMAIGKIVDGFSKISDMFATGGYANMFMGNAPGINNLVKASASAYTAQNMSLFTSGTGLVANMLFGLGNKFTYKGSALMFGGSAQNVAAADVDEYRKAGGLFGGGKTKYDIKYDKEWSEFAQGLVTTITTSINRMAITLGTSANIGNISIPGTAIQTTGRTAEQISTDVQKWLQNVAATLAGTIPELEKFAFAGENYYLALTRLNDALVSTNQRLQEIGAHLIDSTLAGANAAYKLQDLMGGSEAFATKMDTYFTSIFTDAEQKAAKLATAQRLVNNAFAEMGATGITTRAQFKALVNSLDLTTEFGARTFAALMDISEAFGTVTEEAEKTVQTLLKTLADAALEAANTLKDIMGGSLSTKSPTQIYEEQRKAFAEALAAGRTAELPELGKALLEISRTYNASGAAYVSDYDMVTKALMDLAGLSGTPTIDKVQAQINILTDIRDALETQNQAQLAALSGMLGTSSPLYVALKTYLQQSVTASTTADSILNAMKIADLNKQLVVAQTSLTTAQTTKATADAALASYDSPASQLWMLTHGFAPSVIQTGHNNLASGVTTAAQQLQAAMDAVAAIQAQLAALQTIPGHAYGGIASGWSIVGEYGPELAHFGNPARIYTADQSRAIMSGGGDNSDLIAEIRALREEIRASVRVSQGGFIESNEINRSIDRRLQGIESKARLAAAA